MSTLPAVGSTAPPFTLSHGETQRHQFPSAVDDRVQLLFFLKHDCATCTMVTPVVEQLHQALGSAGLRVLAVSQSGPDDTSSFMSRCHATFLTVLDADLEVSDRYGFDAVPALVLTSADGTVLGSFEGWAKTDWNRLVGQAAAACESDTDLKAALSAAIEDLPETHPGCGSRALDPEVARRLAVR